MSSTSPDSKRRRTANPNDDRTLSIINLPHDHITAIADYLPRTSRGLLASKANSKEFVDNERDMCISEASKAIIAMPKNGGWDRIGLFDVGELAARLTDIDIHAVLLHRTS